MMASPSPDVLLLLIVGLALRSADAFSSPPSRRGPLAPPPPPSRIRSTLGSSPLFSPGSGGDGDGDSEFEGFNPFQPGSKMPTRGGFGVVSDDERKRPPPSTPGGRISPRQMRMREITTDLLACLSDDDAVDDLLKSNEDFLLEQLNDVDAVLESDSVYDPDMNREERFVRYREVMDERIEGARAPAAKKALGKLRDFVMSRE